MSRNPFTPTFGQIPPFMAGRDFIINDMLAALENGPGDPNLATIYIGARGTGKTALLSYIAGEAGARGWISVGVSAVPGMLEDILERAREAAAEFVESDQHPRLKSLGIGQMISAEWELPEQDTGNWRTRMNRLFKQLDQYGIGLLITIDEIKVQLDEMINFASTYQHFVRENKRVGLLMAGLPNQVSALLSNESVSFLRRATQHRLGRIADYEIENALAKTVQSSGRTIDPDAMRLMVEAVDGFPYMMQLVGYRAWAEHPDAAVITAKDAQNGIKLAHNDMKTRVLEATYRELSEGDLNFLRAMLPDKHASKVSDVAERMGVKSNYASAYKRRLIEQGIIGERARGVVGFDMPFFKDYLLELEEAYGGE